MNEKVIFKYSFDANVGDGVLTLPIGSEILPQVQVDSSLVYLWALVPVAPTGGEPLPTKERIFFLAPTGVMFVTEDESMRVEHVGTAFERLGGNQYVWHIFETILKETA